MEIKEYLPVILSNGAKIYVESSPSSTRTQISAKIFNFKEVKEVIEGFSNDLVDVFKKINPNKISVQFGIELKVETGQLTTLLIQGEGKSNLQITLEWSNGNK